MSFPWLLTCGTTWKNLCTFHGSMGTCIVPWRRWWLGEMSLFQRMARPALHSPNWLHKVASSRHLLNMQLVIGWTTCYEQNQMAHVTYRRVSILDKDKFPMHILTCSIAHTVRLSCIEWCKPNPCRHRVQTQTRTYKTCTFCFKCTEAVSIASFGSYSHMRPCSVRMAPRFLYICVCSAHDCTHSLAKY